MSTLFEELPLENGLAAAVAGAPPGREYVFYCPPSELYHSVTFLRREGYLLHLRFVVALDLPPGKVYIHLEEIRQWSDAVPVHLSLYPDDHSA